MKAYKSIEQQLLTSYSKLNYKINGLARQVSDVLNLMTTPVKLTRNEHLILRTLPQHLIKTYFTLQGLANANATQISLITGKARAIESSYLCQLTTMGYITKKRLPHSRLVIFSVRNPVETKPEK